MFTFYIENHEPFGSLTKNFPKLDNNKSIVSRFSLFVVYKSAVSTVQKSNYARCFNFRPWMLIFAHLFLDIPMKSTKLHFQSWKKFPQTISLFFCKMTAEVLRNNFVKRHKDWKFPWYISDISINFSLVKAYQMSCLVIFTSIYPPYKTDRFCSEGLAVEMYRMKRLLNFLERKSQRRSACIQINT